MQRPESIVRPLTSLHSDTSHNWIFDEHMLTVTPDYTIQLSKWLKEENNDAGNLWELHKEPILLPQADGYKPAREALENHYIRFKEVQ